MSSTTITLQRRFILEQLPVTPQAEAIIVCAKYDNSTPFVSLEGEEKV